MGQEYVRKSLIEDAERFIKSRPPMLENAGLYKTMADFAYELLIKQSEDSFKELCWHVDEAIKITKQHMLEELVIQDIRTDTGKIK